MSTFCYMNCYVAIKPTTEFDLTSAVCCQFRDITCVPAAWSDTTCCKISQQLPAAWSDTSCLLPDHTIVAWCMIRHPIACCIILQQLPAARISKQLPAARLDSSCMLPVVWHQLPATRPGSAADNDKWICLLLSFPESGKSINLSGKHNGNIQLPMAMLLCSTFVVGTWK
jgi:hypothetical protein